MKLLSPGRTENIGPTGRTRRAWRFGALLASGLLVAAFFVACGPAGQSTSSAASPQATNGATAQVSASGPESVSPLSSTSATSAAAEDGTAQGLTLAINRPGWGSDKAGYPSLGDAFPTTGHSIHAAASLPTDEAAA
jgi:hypothetical protein